jgi:hypothetical protein
LNTCPLFGDTIMTTTVVAAMHDAHVCARATFVAARTAMVQAAVTKRARATAKAANAPSVRAAKLHAVMVAKVLKAANATRLAAVRATRAAAKATAVVKATMVAIDNGVAAIDNGVMVAPAPVNVHEVVAFLAMTPCLCALWFYATLHIADKAAMKEASKDVNRIHATVKAPRVRINDEAKRASITMACANARAVNIQHIATHGSVLSPATVAARAAQGEAAKAANAARKASMPAKTPTVQVVIVRSGPAKNKGAKRVRVVRVHTVESVMAQVAKKAAIIKAKEDAAIAKAKKWAMRKEAHANRKAAMEVIAADAWMLKGVWLSEDLIRGANDWSYEVRISAFKEARNIAYAKKAPVVVGVAA